MATVIKRNADNLAEAPVSDWTPNLKGKDLPEVVVEAFRRLHGNVQNLQQQLQEMKGQPAVVSNLAQPILNTFTELNIGSPATAGGGSVRIRVGLGDPENVVQGTAFRDLWLRVDGTAKNFGYVKESGQDDKVGWVAEF